MIKMHLHRGGERKIFIFQYLMNREKETVRATYIELSFLN